MGLIELRCAIPERNGKTLFMNVQRSYFTSKYTGLIGILHIGVLNNKEVQTWLVLQCQQARQ